MHVEPDPQWILQDKVLTSLQLLAKKKIPFDAIGINLQQLDAIISMAEKIPQLNIMIDHLNQPPLNDEKKIAEWRILMTKAAMAPNMFAKISGLTTLLYQGGRNLEDELKSIIDFTVGQFGADKCCCGSDWPISLLKTTYQDSWKLYEKILVSIDSTASISQQILESTAKNFYHI
jgi:L-fuconolactonase